LSITNLFPIPLLRLLAAVQVRLRKICDSGAHIEAHPLIELQTGSDGRLRMMATFAETGVYRGVVELECASGVWKPVPTPVLVVVLTAAEHAESSMNAAKVGQAALHSWL